MLQIFRSMPDGLTRWAVEAETGGAVRVALPKEILSAGNRGTGKVIKDAYPLGTRD